MKAFHLTLLFSLLSLVLAYSHPVIILDPGHGGKDPGTGELWNIAEKNYTLRTAKMTKKVLEGAGYKVFLTRTKDETLSPNTRVKRVNDLCKRYKNAILISIHYNSLPSKPSLRGFEAYHTSVKGSYLASRILRGVRNQQKTMPIVKNKKRHGLYIIRRTACPAVLLEAGFMSNPSDRANVKHDWFHTRIAKGILSGVKSYSSRYHKG